MSGVAADEGATCLVLVDVDTGYSKAVPALAKTVTDYLVVDSPKSSLESPLALRRRTGDGG